LDVEGKCGVLGRQKARGQWFVLGLFDLEKLKYTHLEIYLSWFEVGFISGRVKPSFVDALR